MWAKGVAVNSGLNVNLCEPDVSPLQLQGPKSGDIARAIFGDRIDGLKYYWLEEFELNGIPLIISRTGWSSELGYEIYLRDGSRGNELWDHIMEIGEPMGLVPGHTSTIRRIEGGMLSYQADMDCTVNPFELGLGRLVDLEMDADYIGKEALTKIKLEGVKRSQVGLEISCAPLEHPNTTYWPIMSGSKKVGYVTSAVYTPRLDKNIALAIMDIEFAALDTTGEVKTPEGNYPVKVVQKPFYDPKKKIASKS
jgi:aminomethyltransferase